MADFNEFFEQFRVAGKDLADKVRELIHEGNVRRIIIKDERGHTFMEIPLTVATVGVILAPVLAAVGAIAALVSHFHVEVERTTERTAPAEPPSQQPPQQQGPPSEPTEAEAASGLAGEPKKYGK